MVALAGVMGVAHIFLFNKKMLEDVIADILMSQNVQFIKVFIKLL